MQFEQARLVERVPVADMYLPLVQADHVAHDVYVWLFWGRYLPLWQLVQTRFDVVDPELDAYWPLGHLERVLQVCDVWLEAS